MQECFHIRPSIGKSVQIFYVFFVISPTLVWSSFRAGLRSGSTDVGLGEPDKKRMLRWTGAKLLVYMN